jgi:hypothetical protein
MGWLDAAERLLSGPRGRRLCWTLLDAGDHPGRARVRQGGFAGDLTGLTRELAACVSPANLAHMAATIDDLALLTALAHTVDRARYWGAPDKEDRALNDPAVQEALLPVAEVVTGTPAAQWWPTPVAIDSQQYVEWLDEHGSPPALTGAAAELAAWRTTTIDDERSAREWPKDPSAPWGGQWWSAPIPSRLPSTTRSIPGLEAVGLALIEDGFGQKSARCWPVETRPGARIYEISSSFQWTELVGRYPLDVSKSRRHDWWRATGWAGRWLIPDFVAAAADYDAVHLSVAGYLRTAGRALSVDDARTVLAGWNPDQTFWLTEVLTSSGPPTSWADLDDGRLGWTLSRASVQPE